MSGPASVDLAQVFAPVGVARMNPIRCTPAMQAGVLGSAFTVADLVEMAA